MRFIKKELKPQRIDNLTYYTCNPFLEIPNVLEITDEFALLLGSPSYLAGMLQRYCRCA